MLKSLIFPDEKPSHFSRAVERELCKQLPMRDTLHILFCSLWGFCLSAQANFHFRHLGPEDGAPSSKIYDFAQDSEGVIWIATDQGLAAYDGTRFRTYTAADGLPNSMIISLEVDAKDGLWVTTMSQPVVYFKDGHATPLAGMDAFRSMDLNTFYAPGDSTLWLKMVARDDNSRQAPLTYLDSRQRIRSVTDTKATQFGAPIVRGDTSLFMYGAEREILHIYQGEVVKRIPLSIPQQIQYCTDWEAGQLLCMVPDMPSHLGGTVFQLMAVHPHTGQTRPVFTAFSSYFAKDNLTTIHVDHADNVWLCLREGLILLRKTGTDQYQPYPLLEGVSVNVIFQDQQQNYWFGTNGGGIYFLPSLQVQYWQPQPSLGRGSIMTVEGEPNGNIWLGYATGYLEQLQVDLTIGYSQKIAPRRIVDVVHTPEQKWIASDKRLFSLSNNNSLREHTSVKESLKRIQLIDGKLYLFSESIFRWHEDSLSNLHSTDDDRIYAVAGTEQQLYLGTAGGLFTYTPQAAVPYRRVIDDLRTNIREIIAVGDSSYWLATQGLGIIILQDGMAHSQLREEDGLASNIVNDLLITDDYIWVATNQGVSRIHPPSREIRNFSTKDGLSSNEINFVTRAGHQIVAATTHGVNLFADKIIPDRAPPLLHFKKLLVNSQAFSLMDTLQLKNYQNAIQIEYIGIAYRSTTPIEYAYQLDGLDAAWLYTTATTLHWSAVPPGQYQLRLKARGQHTDWSAERCIWVSIAYPWWQSTWFYIAVSVAVLLLFGGILLVIEHQNRRKRQHIRWQLTALRAQMNPHFMFNILNSVQDFIYQNDQFSANQYLAKFAGLMRGILHESTKEEVILQAEINQLQRYLDLEQLRLEHFTYRMDWAPDVMPRNIIIPGMLIQPFVENAIKHGLFHRQGQKHLRINFRYLSAFLLECVVEDNGVGRIAAARIRDQQNIPHNAKATLLTQERLKVLTRLQRKRFKLHIEDKTAATTGEALGTRVTLHIPYKTI